MEIQRQWKVVGAEVAVEKRGLTVVGDRDRGLSDRMR